MTCNRQKTKGSAKDILWCRSASKLLNFKKSTVKDQFVNYSDHTGVEFYCVFPSVLVMIGFCHIGNLVHPVMMKEKHV